MCYYEDVPGVGENNASTLLFLKLHYDARMYKRIQIYTDLLPSDVKEFSI